jgi:hypothetical protein
MKKYSLNTIKILKVGLIVVLISFLSSCDKWIDPELNVDPDSPADVPMSLILPAIEQQIGFNLLGNNSALTTNIWMQAYDGVTRQCHTFARYTFNAADIDNYWDNTYTRILMNTKILIDKGEAENSPYNAGIGKVIMAYTLGIMTDLFGDIPYSEALQGSDNVLKPVYDTQEQIYNSIFSLLDAAIADLSKPAADNLVPVASDVIYGNSSAAWLNAARAIKARSKLQLSKVNGSAAYTDALALTDAFESIDDDMQVPFEEGNKNPLFQFMEQRTDARMCSYFVNLLTASDDPRLSFYAALDADGNYTGSDPGGEFEAASKFGTYNSDATSPVVMMSYAELKFIEAEAAFQTNDKARALTAFKDAVAASVLRVTGEANTEWLDANVNNISEGSLTLEDIMMQKYIALYSQIQPFSDWRRTGYPNNLTLAANATKTEIPRRFPYAQSEIIYNPDNVPSVGSIIDHVWWDK